jgi:saccharopine dehydrogenase-like NADP-dependent oxidoreductase
MANSQTSRRGKTAATRRPRPRITVIGGAGAMGRLTIRDLVETAPPTVDIVLADRDAAAARAVVRGLPAARRRRVRIATVDAADVAGTARALAGTTVLINACHHSFNLRVMRVALDCGSHYCDLGGLFHVTRQQLRLHRRFERAGLLALCGIGSAPGIVNVMARAAADALDSVSEIHIAVGTVDLAPRPTAVPLATSYSIDTVLDEASCPAALFTNGKLVFVEPLSGDDPVDFPKPVGRQHPARTLHSELATLPASFADLGVREVSFRIAFPGDLMARLRFLHRLGLTGRSKIRVAAGGGRSVRVAPRDVLLALLAQAPAAAPPPATAAMTAAMTALKAGPATPAEEYEVLRVIVRGREGGKAVEIVSDCLVPGIPAWGLGVDADTGCPPSIVAQMILGGAIGVRGVLPPERAVPPEPFFRALADRGLRITQRIRVPSFA